MERCKSYEVCAVEEAKQKTVWNHQKFSEIRNNFGSSEAPKSHQGPIRG